MEKEQRTHVIYISIILVLSCSLICIIVNQRNEVQGTKQNVMTANDSITQKLNAIQLLETKIVDLEESIKSMESENEHKFSEVQILKSEKEDMRQKIQLIECENREMKSILKLINNNTKIFRLSYPVIEL